MERTVAIKPFSNCPALDGYHCQTNSVAKIFQHYGHPLSEDMILGLGAGMGFIYWKMKMDLGSYVFIGGRGNNKDFFNDVGKRTGVKTSTLSTMSASKAETALLEQLAKEEPVMMFGDMGLLPWFELPEDYHFGGHTFVVCGFDGKNTALVSDMDQKATGLKKGFYCEITLEQLRKARGSTHKPFPPKNTYLAFDFGKYHDPRSEDLISAVKQTAESQLNPPIKNLGVKGIRYTANEILKWPQMFDEKELRMNLFSLYIYIEIGGTGGGCFRYMYSRFLTEAAKIVGNKALGEASAMFDQAGRKFTEIGLMFENAEKMQ
ncbi:BtrH N-terminal domain-containing protein, partial [Candidatus Bathyarchaeota archaeon]|nr:BtrH N-terminal domain-containing protein [Candidatus Bathyarchaeota archaeon]